MAKKRETLFGLIWAVLFLLYNGIMAAVLLIADTASLTLTFWTALVFAEVSLLALLVTLLVLGKTLTVLRDWFFGYPLVRHCVSYLVLTMIAAAIFMAFQNYIIWPIALAVLLLLLVIYAVFALSCVIAKRAIQEIDEQIKEKRLFIDLLRVDVQLLSESCDEAAAKKIFDEYAELVRFSDPMSNEALFELEKEIQLATMQATTALQENRIQDALAYVDQAKTMLIERNKKCKALKGLRG